MRPSYALPAYHTPAPVYRTVSPPVPLLAPWQPSNVGAARLATTVPAPASPPFLIGAGGTYLGVLSSNRYDPNSVSNPYGRYGSPYSSTSINNPYGRYGSPYSATSTTNPYTTTAPSIIGPNGLYLGQLSANPYSASSITNPYGAYGSPYSPTSVTNPYGPYGNLFGSNPFAIAPIAPIAPMRILIPKND